MRTIIGWNRLDPSKIRNLDDQKRVARWLEVNGETHWIALEPVHLLLGRWAFYQIWPKDGTVEQPIPTWRRIQIPLRRVR